jgi:hypothetical protein
MLALRGAGAGFVLLNEAVVQPQGDAVDFNRLSHWRVGPDRLDADHPAYVAVDVAATLKGLRPLAPCQLRAQKTSTGVLLSWLRQTRIGGDSWDIADVPLGETAENYSLQVFDGAVLKRSWTPTAPHQLYSTADMVGDFGATPASFTLRVAQTSTSLGAGAILEGTINV